MKRSNVAIEKSQLTACVALSLLPHVGAKTLNSLMEHFGSVEAILAADLNSLLAIKGVGRKIAEAILAINLEATEREVLQWQKAGLSILPYFATECPPPLRDIPDYPPTLFLRGKLLAWEKRAAIVGTEKWIGKYPKDKTIVLYCA